MASVSLLEAASWCGPSCVAASVGDKVAVPWDCTKYAVCADMHGDGVLWPSDATSCPDDQYFDATTVPQKCVPIDGADTGFCQNSCSPCELLWTAIGELSPDPDDCGTYYAGVDDGGFVPIHCESDEPYYDYRNGHCSDDERLCFGYCNRCQAYCVGSTYIADPQDCTGFYYCTPPEVTHFHCLLYENYDAVLNICSSSADCITC